MQWNIHEIFFTNAFPGHSFLQKQKKKNTNFYFAWNKNEAYDIFLS